MRRIRDRFVPSPRETTAAAVAALAADVVCVVGFAALGRRTHAGGLSAAGVAETAWPFLAGVAAGWLLARGWRHPAAVAPTGVTVWVCTVVAGMVLRRATSAGTAASFILVATLVTGLLLIGWRSALAVSRRSGRRH